MDVPTQFKIVLAPEINLMRNVYKKYYFTGPSGSALLALQACLPSLHKAGASLQSWHAGVAVLSIGRTEHKPDTIMREAGFELDYTIRETG